MTTVDGNKNTRPNVELPGIENLDVHMNEFWQRLTACSDIPLNRFCEICEAEKNGLLVVLPCKVGDMVWYAPKYCEEPECGYVEEISTINGYTLIAFYIDPDTHMEAEIKDFGKTVFLTRAEAEEALKGGTA